MSGPPDSPEWPSLYNFFKVDVVPISSRDPIQPNGFYLHHVRDMYRFTLYWTLIFYVPAFAVCGAYTFFNLAFPPSRRRPRAHRNRPSFPFLEAATYSPIPATASDIPLQRQQTFRSGRSSRRALATKPRPKLNERRSRLTFALLVLLVFFLAGFAGAVVGSAIVGYVMAGLYKAAKFNMSTWFPFFSGLILTSVGFLGLWPSLIDII
ncbi:hypothetical protein EIP91_003319 [Steccherinum ochraceum]|uniref:Uncharacterized protein n=1 Tax=Steccherinum ochraceum TaxID=92696 RepID=A0A4R0RAQ6_9APHY|nr:hypothetical protein EIP91_003319 [Steccherinum ochraceum]